MALIIVSHDAASENVEMVHWVTMSPTMYLDDLAAKLVPSWGEGATPAAQSWGNSGSAHQLGLLSLSSTMAQPIVGS